MKINYKICVHFIFEDLEKIYDSQGAISFDNLNFKNIDITLTITSPYKNKDCRFPREVRNLEILFSQDLSKDESDEIFDDYIDTLRFLTNITKIY